MDDLYVRLQKALDSAEGQIDMRADDPHRPVQVKIRGAWRFMDQSVAVGLVKRDRELLADHQPRTLGMLVEGKWVHVVKCGSCSPFSMLDYTPWPCAEVYRAAEFWLTDTETTDGRTADGK